MFVLSALSVPVQYATVIIHFFLHVGLNWQAVLQMILIALIFEIYYASSLRVTTQVFLAFTTSPRIPLWYLIITVSEKYNITYCQSKYSTHHFTAYLLLDVFLYSQHRLYTAFTSDVKLSTACMLDLTAYGKPLPVQWIAKKVPLWGITCWLQKCV